MTTNTNLLDLGIEHVAAGAFRIYQQGLVQHFNTLIMQFSKDLKIAYGSQCDLRLQIDMMNELLKKDNEFLIKQFYAIASTKIGIEEDLADDARDDFVLTHLKDIPIFRSLQLHIHWAETPEETKVNIWKYIQQLWKCSVHFHEESKDSMIDRAMEVVQTQKFHASVISLISKITNVSGKEESDHPFESLVSHFLKSVDYSAEICDKNSDTDKTDPDEFEGLD